MLLAQGPRDDGLVVREPLLSARRRIERLVGLPRRVRGVRCESQGVYRNGSMAVGPSPDGDITR